MSEFRRMLMSGGELEPPNYLCFTALEDGTFSFTIGSSVSTGGRTGSGVTYVEYSIDNGQTWTKTIHESKTTTIITTPLIITGNTVLWRGSAKNYGVNNGFKIEQRCYFESTEKFIVSGNIASLLTPSSFVTSSNTSYLFPYLFWSCVNLTSARDLILIDTGAYGYYSLFAGCTSLVDSPIISNLVLKQ